MSYLLITQLMSVGEQLVVAHAEAVVGHERGVCAVAVRVQVAVAVAAAVRVVRQQQVRARAEDGPAPVHTWSQVKCVLTLGSLCLYVQDTAWGWLDFCYQKNVRRQSIRRH